MQWKSAARGIRYREHPERKHGKRPDRYWCIQYRHDGKTINEAVGWWSTGASQAECERLLAVLRENWRSGQGPQSLREMRQAGREAREVKKKALQASQHENISLADFWQHKYLPRAQTSKSAKSINTEESIFRSWLQPLANMPLRNITADNIEALVVRPILAAGRSARTVQYVLAVVSQVWNTAKDMGIINGDNPAAKIKRPRQDNKRVRFLSVEEANLLLDALKKRSSEVYELAMLSLFSGLRAGECLNLTWADIDFKNNSIFIKDTKSGRNRHVYMTTEIIQMLQAHPLKERQKLQQPVFSGSARWGVSSTFARTVADLKLNHNIADPRQKVVFHTLRHTFASWLVQRGVPLYNVSQLLGHSDIKMTMRYAHLAPDNQRVAAMALEGSLNRS